MRDVPAAKEFDEISSCAYSMHCAKTEGENGMIRWDDGKKKEKLSDMWYRIFHDTVPYIHFYFDEVYGKNEVILEESQDEIRGMLHLNPYILQSGEETMEASYIVGVSTEEEYRRQGIMRSLLGEAFHSLRERGHAFTYLMPADENYYLPFSFRFGMKEYIQEIDPGSLSDQGRDYTFHRSGEIEHDSFAYEENKYRRSHYAISTQVSPTYFERLEKEVKSEFGLFFYVKKEGIPIGRFVAYAEDDFMSISQMVCYSENKIEFLQEILIFCDRRYHFRSYRIRYAQDWKKELLHSNQFDNIRIMTSKEQDVIMFRILRLEDMARWLRASSPVSCILQVIDPDLEEQSGNYEFVGDQNQMTIKKVTQEADGVISIGDLTQRFFGPQPEVISLPPSFHEKAIHFWQEVKALSPIEISEIV